MKSEQVELTPIGKLVFTGVIGWITANSKLNWNIKGDEKNVAALTKAVIASKAFHDEISRPGATVESVIEKMNEKAFAAKEFEETTGRRWPLI